MNILDERSAHPVCRRCLHALTCQLAVPPLDALPPLDTICKDYKYAADIHNHAATAHIADAERRVAARRDMMVHGQGLKTDAGKPRWDLIPPFALQDVAAVLEFGARKYAPDNWRKVEGARWRYLRAGIGHTFAVLRGERLDSESGLPHLAHAICSLMFVLELDR